MKRQYLTYYSLQWTGRIFWGKCAVNMQRHWSSHILGFPSMCSDSFAKPRNAPRSPPAARLLLSKPAGSGSSVSFSRRVLWCGVTTAVHIIPVWRLNFHMGLKFPILQVLQCNILGAVYALYIFHERRLSPESEMWEKSVHQQLRDFQVGDENSRYLHVRLCISLQNGVNVQIDAAGLHPSWVCHWKHNR